MAESANDLIAMSTCASNHIIDFTELLPQKHYGGLTQRGKVWAESSGKGK